MVPYEGKKTKVILSRNKAKWSFHFISDYSSQASIANRYTNLPLILIGGNNKILNINISSPQANDIYFDKWGCKFGVAFKNIKDTVARFEIKGELENNCNTN